MWLFSTYAVKLPRPLLVRSETGDAVSMLVNVKGWDAEVRLIPATRLGRIRPPASGGWHYPVSQLEITVARDGELGDEMVHEEGARAVVERLLVFLQLRLRHSLFEAIERYQQFYADADPASGAARDWIEITPQLSRVADYAERNNMHDYMCELFSKALCRGLLSDAASSIAHGRSRRACLELTMACETALGMRLEAAGLVKAGIGSVFRNQHSEAADEIVRLFQARDAMRHAGDGLFRFVSAARWREIEANLTRWQAAVECLADWLNAMNQGLQEAL
ncbi:hypothetical protein Tel_16070 [Candidatus Tenderia electrophaga]|jgi:hypothetical protein|uniref:Uncharacterized protein n=1 Tax=Candidatus Tenderia electrophaga TaxID=1748243 RepID=A0A0S2THB4_9GAMM|nr:hypothetical protein Tel_16070 [Candidatus Tenderia electrophaga]